MNGRHPVSWVLLFTAFCLICDTGFGQDAAVDEKIKAKVKNGKDHIIEQLEFKQTKIVDALRLIEELSGVNAVATQDASRKEATLFLKNIKAGDAIDTLCKISNLWYREDLKNGIYRIMTTEEYQKDLVVFRQDVTRIFTLLHPNVVSIAASIEDLFGERVRLSFGTDGDQIVGQKSGFGVNSGGVSGDLKTTAGSRTDTRSDESQDEIFSDSRNFRRSTRSDTKSERIIDEKLTADQIAKIEERVKDGGQQRDQISFDALRGISRQETPIFVTINREHNLIMVRTGDFDALKAIEELIKEVDRPTPQVLLEMKILELKLGDDFKSIFDIEYAGGEQKNPLLSADTVANQNVIGMGNFPLEGATFVYQYINNTVRARIQLLEGKNRVNVLATPMLLASNNRSARVFVGEERVLTTGVKTDVVTSATGPTATAVEPITEVRDIGNTLEILPKINADRTVTLFIKQDTSTVLTDSTSIPVVTNSGILQEFAIDSVSTANLEGVVAAKDGLTIAVGGLIKSTISENQQKVPLLGDIPILGTVFRKTVKDNEKTEIVLLITPHILMTPAEGQQRSAELMKKLSNHPFHEGAEKTIDSHFENKSIFKEKPKDKKPS